MKINLRILLYLYNFVIIYNINKVDDSKLEETGILFNENIKLNPNKIFFLQGQEKEEEDFECSLIVIESVKKYIFT